MDVARSYARALYALTASLPEGAKAGELLANLRAALARRGHGKLLPRIFAEYQKLALKEERARAAAAITPERERTRILLDLYRKLIAH